MSSTPSAAAFEEYRRACDADSASSWIVGISDPPKYAAALEDGRTLFGCLDGRRAPVLAPIEYVDGYDAERCRSLTERQQVMVLTVPPSAVRRGALRREDLSGGRELTSDLAVVVASPDGARRRILSALAVLGDLEAREFRDPRLADQQGHETAWMALHSGSFAAGDRPAERRAADIDEAWRHYCQDHRVDAVPAGGGDGPHLLDPGQLAASPALEEALWEIARTGFGGILGRYHPVAMDAGREAFTALLRAESARASLYYRDGRPVCFGLITFDPSRWHRVRGDSDALRRDLEDARAHGETPVYFTTLSSSAAGMGFAHRVIALLIDLFSRTGREHRVTFESTNLSATYIPRMVNRQAERAREVTLKTSLRLLDKVDYWYAVPPAER